MCLNIHRKTWIEKKMREIWTKHWLSPVGNESLVSSLHHRLNYVISVQKSKMWFAFTVTERINVIKENFPKNWYFHPFLLHLALQILYRTVKRCYLLYPVGKLLVCHESLGARFSFSIASPYFFPCSIFVISILMAEKE